MTMEIRLKERLVGAVVLVFAAVIFIPMVLDGPNANRRVSQNVALPDPVGNDARRTVRLDLDGGTVSDPSGSEPPTESREPASIDLVPAQEKAAEPAVEANEPSTAVATNPAPARDEPVVQQEPVMADDAPWTVQAGSFSRDENAETLAAKLRKLGYAAYVSRYRDGKQTHYRVRVGGFPSRDAAQLKADEIRTRTGEPATPVQAN